MNPIGIDIRRILTIHSYQEMTCEYPNGVRFFNIVRVYDAVEYMIKELMRYKVHYSFEYVQLALEDKRE